MNFNDRYKIFVPPLIILIISLVIRYYFFSGFILGDDLLELQISINSISWNINTRSSDDIRIMLWFFNFLSFKLFGISEFSFFLPTMLMSATIPLVVYFSLRQHNYSFRNSIFAAIIFATAPFEVLIGGLRANDLIFTWFISLAYLTFIIIHNKPKIMGTLSAVFLFCAFYVKIWVVYLFPAIGIYILLEFRKKRFAAGLTFIFTTICLHSVAGIIWLQYNGMFMTFFKLHSATYPVEPERLKEVFLQYPKAIFQGTDFGNTLFGSGGWCSFVSQQPFIPLGAHVDARLQ